LDSSLYVITTTNIIIIIIIIIIVVVVIIIIIIMTAYQTCLYSTQADDFIYPEFIGTSDGFPKKCKITSLGLYF